MLPVDLAAFEASLQHSAPPSGLADVLRALWHERRGDWGGAHAIAQDIPGRDGAWVHAYLHRREGDDSNAAYWYARAGKPVPDGDLHEEWRTIAATFLERPSR